MYVVARKPTGTTIKDKIMEYTIRLPYGQVDEIIIKELTTVLRWLKRDREQRKNDEGMAIFDTDKKTDLKKLKEHIKAVELILEYYGVKEDDIL
jgi:transcription initiation factor IIE alpha subunit